jgi:hypothetical protein
MSSFKKSALYREMTPALFKVAMFTSLGAITFGYDSIPLKRRS